MRVALLVLLQAAGCSCILPEIVDSGIIHILQDSGSHRQTELVEVERLPEEPTPRPDYPGNVEKLIPQPYDLLPDHHNGTDSDKVTDNESVTASTEQETNNNTTAVQSSDLDNDIDQGCVTDEDCGRGGYCLFDRHKSKCRSCKATDVPCTEDEECCGEEMCVWGQCSQNATKGEAGSTCQHQTDCSPDLCCAFHKALLFPVCTAKPIERERCLDASNHLVELLSWDSQDQGPRKHCPCAGDLHCQHLGRGSMCLKGEDSSEEDLTDTMYSEIDYII